MDINFKKYSILDRFNVSRGTCIDFEKFISLIKEKNQEINIISKKTDKISIIRERHIIDSAQAIDFIDLNDNICSDLGTGAGLPGVVLAIMMKNLNKSMKFKLYEKSHLKSNFRSEEHTSELQSLVNLVCRLLLEKKKIITNKS